MTFIGELTGSSPDLKISLYKWNAKFFVKFETPDLEQVYKIPEMDASEPEIREMIDEEFIQKVILRFREMYADISEIY
jgi:protein-tyrosine phosphatase